MLRESEVLKVAKEKRVRTDFLASKVTWVSRVTRVRLEYWDPEERTALRAPRASQDPTEKLAAWDQLERRENLESLDCLGTLEDKVPRAPMASLDSPGQMARRERGESPANLALEDNEAQRVHVVGVALEVQQENQVQRAPQAMMDLLARQERGDLKDHRDLSVSPDPKDPMAHQEKMGCPVIQDREERRASKERQDLQDQEGWLDHRVQLGRRDPVESEDIQALLVHLVSRVYLEPLEKKVERVIQVPRVLVESQGLKA